MGPLEGTLYKEFVQASLNWDHQGVWTYSHYDDPACAKEHGVEYPSVSLIRHFDNELYKVEDS